MKRLFWLIFLPITLCAQSYYGDVNGQKFSAKLQSIPNAIHLDEVGHVEVKISYPDNFKLHSVSHEASPNELEWITQAERIEPQDGSSLLLKMQFDPKMSGKHYLSLPTLHFVSKEDPKIFKTLYPPLVAIEVQDCSKNLDQLMRAKETLSLDLRRPIEINMDNEELIIKQSEKHLQKLLLPPSYSYEKWMIRIVLTLMLVFMVFMAFQWLKKRGWQLSPLTPTQDPKEQALEELKLLQKQMLVQKGYFEEFYVRLTQIVRTYIERRFEIKAPEQTTQEFLEEALSKNLFQSEMNEYLKEFLQFADLVKFAKLHPLPAECLAAEQAAYRFIEHPVHFSKDQKVDHKQNSSLSDARL